MRSSNKSRSRNKNSNRNRSNVGNVVNRVFDSAGPEGKVRGTPSQIIEKYTTLTRDAQLSGDRVAAENFQQHAEHYNRLLNEAQREQAERQAAEARNRPQQQTGGNGANGDNQSNFQQNGGQPDTPREQPLVHDGLGDQPDVVMNTDDSVSAELVETPEDKSAKPAKPAAERKPRTRARRPAPSKSETPEPETSAQAD